MNMEIVETALGNITVIKAAGDGNCLFSTICCQLYNSKVGSTLHNESVRVLRGRVASYLRKHAGETRYKNCIICRISEEMPHLVGLTYDTQVDQFINFL